jgi:sugar lactone lactonase YvrE
MPMTPRTRPPLSAILLLALTLTGCAGGGSSGSPAGASAPPGALGSPITTLPSSGPSAAPSPSRTPLPTSRSTLPPGVLAVAESDGYVAFQSPNGIAIDAAGDVLVHDSANARIVRLDPTGRPISTFGQRGAGPGDFAFLGFGGVAVDGDEILVVDNGTHSIKTFAADGTYRSAFGSEGPGDGQLMRPVYVAVGPGPDRLRYVTDDRKPFVQVFDPSGTFRFSFGGAGTGDGQFRHETGIAVAADGNVAVADYLDSRIQLFDASGHFVRAFGGRGDGPGQLAGPDGIAVDSAGRWYVSDVSNHRIDVFAGDGTSLGSIPLGFTQMAEAPAGITIAGDGTIWVADAHVSIVLHLPRPAFLPA